MSVLSSNLPELHVDLDALVQNYHSFAKYSGDAQTGAAVKANAYGLGVAAVAPTLHDAGCNSFFVAHLGEGVQLRQLIGINPEIYILHGPDPNNTDEFLHYDLRPVLNTKQQISLWKQNGKSKPAALHVDTGMNRLGIPFRQAASIKANDLNLSLVMSHLSCASAPEHPLNTEQLNRFTEVCRLFPSTPASLSNSAGVLLGPQFHFDLTRPGIGLYGANPLDYGQKLTKLAPVTTLLAPVLQVNSVATGQSIGYGATFCAPRAMKIATIGYGYADGILRAASPGANGWIAGQAVPLLGRISMDLMAVDISAIEDPVKSGDKVTFFGTDLDAFANNCNTIAYEILTGIGPRVKRIYSRAAS